MIVDTNRPKDEAERHKRTLESKRRWAAKNRQDKRKDKRPSTASRKAEKARSESREGSYAALEGGQNDAGAAAHEEPDVSLADSMPCCKFH